jgi:ATP-dependent Clp protease protease subunit
MANLIDPRAGLGGIALQSPQARYILPSFIEHSSFGVKESNPYVRADVATVCLGQAASAAAVLLAAGTPGKRACLPNARVLIHQPSLEGGIQGQVSDLEIQAAEIERMRRLMETTLAYHTGKDADTIRKDTDRDKILTAAEAKDYGIIDTVFDYRKLSAQK